MARKLFGPGPTNVPEPILAALAQPTIGHLDPVFLETMDDISERLRRCMLTSNPLTFVLSAPGSLGMEASFVNLLEPGDRVVICINGVFGGRMLDICERLGAEVIVCSSDWGEPVDVAGLREILENESDIAAVAFVHAETSTGVLSDAKEIAKVAHEFGSLVIADCVTSLAGVELRVDDWRIDVAYSGSQKCLSCVPGMSPISFSTSAVDKVRNRKTKVQSWFCDVSLLMSYYESGNNSRAYHHTAPVNSLFAVNEAMRIVLDESLEARWKRHTEVAEYLWSKLEHIGLEPIVDRANRLAPLTLIRIPEGVDDGTVRNQLLATQNLEIGGGLGRFAGKAWRIGLMGSNATKNNVDMLIDALSRS